MAAQATLGFRLFAFGEQSVRFATQPFRAGGGSVHAHVTNAALNEHARGDYCTALPWRLRNLTALAWHLGGEKARSSLSVPAPRLR